MLCDKKEICGSCSWSEIPYEQQLKDKLNNINLTAQKEKIPFKCENILFASETNHYRNKMDFVINYKGEFGLHEKGKWWKVIDNHTCFLPDNKIIDLYHKLYPWVKNCGLSYYDRKANMGILRYAIIRATTLGDTMVIILTSAPTDDVEASRIKEIILSLTKTINVTSLIWSYTKSKSDISFGDINEVLYGKPYINEDINGYKFIIRPNSFFQTNSNAAKILQSTVLDLIKKCNLPRESKVLDLYCGSGFFTLPLANIFKNTFGVESVQDAVSDALDNAKANNMVVDFRCDLAEKIYISDYSPDFILVDPPRAGLHKKVIEDLMSNSPEYLLYVSCKHEKFFEEMKILQRVFMLFNASNIIFFFKITLASS